MEYEKKQKIKFILFSIFIYALCSLLIGLGASDYVNDQGKLSAIQGGIIVQAKWVGIIPRAHGQADGTYDLGYEYIDENGVRYREQCCFGLRSLEEAESYIGKTVYIYIDGNGHSIPVFAAKDFNKNGAWALMGIAIGIVVCYTIGLIIWGIIRYRRKKHGDSEDDTPSDIA
ncbi:MAG: hypothetical protein K2I75_02095 [Clostridiales bacterium]|nr:hypothetical protein [Clostridiales bacterium]